MKSREPSMRVTTPEILGIDESVSEGADGVTYGLTELGLLVNRFLLSGQFIGKMEEGDMIISRVKDSFNEISLYIGSYFDDSLDLLDELQENDDIIVIGKVSFGSSTDQLSKRFYAESIVKVQETVRKYLEVRAVFFMNERLNKISKAISSGTKEQEEISAIMGSKNLGSGLFKRFQSRGSVDVEKFSALVSSFVEKSGRQTREMVLDKIKKQSSISIEDLQRELNGKMGRELIEQEIRNLMNDGEIMELKSGIYKYVS